jgi:hypothetical protein
MVSELHHTLTNKIMSEKRPLFFCSKTVSFLLFYPGEGPLSSRKKITEDFNKLLNTDALIALKKHFQFYLLTCDVSLKPSATD